MKTSQSNGVLAENSVAAEDDPALRAHRRLRGKALRKSCPRSSHASADPSQAGRDPLALIEHSNQGRVEKLLPVRFLRMAESAFAYFRGTAIVQAEDLKRTASTGLLVQCCGDCHLLNFGGFATPERDLVFDINDFDETHPGPFEWDLKRLVTSVVLAARWRGFSDKETRRILRSLFAAYRTGMERFAQMTVLETWYDKISFSKLLEDAANDPKYLKQMKKSVEKATLNTSEHVFRKIVTTEDGKPRIVDAPPLLYHAGPADADFEADLLPFMKKYRRSLPRDRQVLFDRFRLVDSAVKVVGVGSVGTRCYIALFVDNQADHLFLQVKEAHSSVLEGRAGPSSHANNGERVVSGQRLMQSASDIFLGWTRGLGGDYYVRQMRDRKLATNLAAYAPRMLRAYAALCGRTLARAHAKSGDAAMIAGYLGDGTVFDDALECYARAYADQVERDYDCFVAAVNAGRFSVESTAPLVQEES